MIELIKGIGPIIRRLVQFMDTNRFAEGFFKILQLVGQFGFPGTDETKN